MLDFTPEEMAVIHQLAEAKDLTPFQVLRQSLRTYQLIHDRTMRGYRLYFAVPDKKTIDFTEVPRVVSNEDEK